MVFLMAVKSEQSMQRLPENGKRCFQAAKLFLYLSFIYLFFRFALLAKCVERIKKQIGFFAQFFFWMAVIRFADGLM